jgi:hypothetical protein
MDISNKSQDKHEIIIVNSGVVCVGACGGWCQAKLGVCILIQMHS